MNSPLKTVLYLVLNACQLAKIYKVVTAGKTIFLRALLILFFCLSSVFGISAYASIDVFEFQTTEQEVQYRDLIEEFRCPKCQNQNLAGSDAPIAQDLKRKTYEQVMAGKTDDEIRSFMIERYGDFISYKPPVRPSTYLLWYFPPVFLILLIIVWSYKNKFSHQNSSDNSLDETSHNASNDVPNDAMLPLTKLSTSATSEPAQMTKQLGLGFELGVCAMALVLTAILYVFVQDRSQIHKFWSSKQHLNQVAEELLTGQIQRPPDWAIATPDAQQNLIATMQANLHRNPSDKDRWLTMADLYLALQNQSSALIATERAVRIDPSDTQLALNYVKVSYFINAETLDKKAGKTIANILKNDPNHQGVIMLMIMANSRAGEYEEALLWLDKLKSIVKLSSQGETQAEALANLETLEATIKRQTLTDSH